MRAEPNLRIEHLRQQHPALPTTPPGVNYGFFVDGPLAIISSGTPDVDMSEWEHVSVSCVGRTPTWDEMQRVKELFWDDSETVLQFHPRRDKYVNIHPHVLHMWKRLGEDHVLPPRELV